MPRPRVKAKTEREATRVAEEADGPYRPVLRPQKTIKVGGRQVAVGVVAASLPLVAAVPQPTRVYQLRPIADPRLRVGTETPLPVDEVVSCTVRLHPPSGGALSRLLRYCTVSTRGGTCPAFTYYWPAVAAR